MILIIAWYIATYITLSTAVTEVTYGNDFCGKHSIPYKISINRNGSPEIFCKTPACLGKDTRINTGLYNTHQYQSRRNMTVICDAFKETVCTGELQWTSALLESNNKTQKTLKTKCCSYPGMSDAEQLRIIFLGLGDSYEGGVIRKDGYFGGFDLIKEVRKTITTDNKVKYLVTVNRLPCDMNSNEGKEDRRFYSKPYILRSKRRQQDIRMRGLKKKYWNEDDESEVSHQHDGSRRNGDYTALNYDTRRIESGRRKSIKLFRKEYSDADNNDDDGEDDDYDVLIPRKIVARMMADRNWLFLNSEMLSKEFFERKSPSSFKEDPEEVIVDSGSVSTDKISEQLLPFPSSAPKMQSRQNNVAHSANTYLEPILLQDESSGPVPLSANNYVQPQEHQDFSSTDSNNYVTQYPYSYHKSMKFDDPQSLPQQYVQAAPESAPTNQYYSPSYSYPVYNPGLNGIFNRMQCFSGDMEVETPAGFKAIKDLEIGDMVLSIDESMVTFSPIIMFLHKLDDEEAEFNLLEMELGHSLKLTNHHLLYVTSCGDNEPMKILPAMDVVVAQCVYITREGNKLEKHKIFRISKVLGVGIYAPLTSTGDIFVNRVLSSCHSNLALKTLQQTFFIAYNRFSNILKRFSPKSNNGEENLPYGLPYLTTVIDLFLPKSVL